MGIWIRSQNKRRLVNANMVEVVEDGKKHKVYAVDLPREINLKGICMGTYETEERAIEVLDEIQNEILHGQIIIVEGLSYKVENRIVVYQMPEK